MRGIHARLHCGRITTGEHVRADTSNEWQLGVDVKCDVNTRATVLYCTAVQLYSVYERVRPCSHSLSALG